MTELLSRGSLEDVIREGGLQMASYGLILNLALQVHRVGFISDQAFFFSLRGRGGGGGVFGMRAINNSCVSRVLFLGFLFFWGFFGVCVHRS